MIEPHHLSATRAGYDAIADEYAEAFAAGLSDQPYARAMLTAFAELVRGGGPVLDVGCGTGDATGHLHALGIPVSGLDLSASMLAIARRTHPGPDYRLGSLTDLDVADGSLGGICASYSLIHVPPPHVPAALAGFHRALRPGGHLLLAFQVGTGVRHFDEAFGHRVDLDYHRFTPDGLTRLLADAGFTTESVLRRTARGTELTPHAHLIARKPPG
ncbi:class I SAM-dependent DNA methyltransferase [Actinokineospora bangkokensis]|uniref:Methyltransferase n=1 Tax=Actinokineospora bangkokensis TaxID=1193682 RepID=A0A1Q9LKB3_9PSEU|nr:class I SAM-dependent methyltransferase [Actinokineospora bangkokensis]OLR92486.1 methyltransferase [Actinokineospora bangkokensis]